MNHKQIYEKLEPMLSDYRRMAIRSSQGYQIIHMDEFVDQLINQEIVCNVNMPRLSKRYVLEEDGLLKPYQSKLKLEDQESSDNGHAK